VRWISTVAIAAPLSRIAVDGGLGCFTRDHVFSSPSTAGAIVVGRSCNGRNVWVSTEGQTFGVWEDRGVLEM
jgi:hypothetical protein